MCRRLTWTTRGSNSISKNRRKSSAVSRSSNSSQKLLIWIFLWGLEVQIEISMLAGRSAGRVFASRQGTAGLVATITAPGTDDSFQSLVHSAGDFVGSMLVQAAFDPVNVVDQAGESPADRVGHQVMIQVDAAVGEAALDGLDDAAGNADHRHFGRDILGHHRIGPYPAVAADGDRPQDLGPRPAHDAV